MERFLITQSLMSSWGYMFNCYENGQEDAYADFIRTLNREPGVQTKAMCDGIAFENEVYRAAAGVPRQPHKDWEQGVQAVATVLRGAPTQIRVQREIEVCDMNLLLYGVLDAMSAGVIYDVKYTSKSFGSTEFAGKYFDSPQHPSYLYMVPEAHRFEYLVSDGRDLYTETYDRNITRPVSEIITEFIQSITLMNLLDVYKEKWAAR